MGILAIPTFQDPSYRQRTTLDGTLYTLQFDYNQRCASWYLSIADVDGVDIYNGVKLVVGVGLLKKCRDPRRPPGVMMVTSTSADSSPPGIDELGPGGRCQLLYLTADWATTIRTGGITGLIVQVKAGATTSSSLSLYGET